MNTAPLNAHAAALLLLRALDQDHTPAEENGWLNHIDEPPSPAELVRMVAQHIVNAEEGNGPQLLRELSTLGRQHGEGYRLDLEGNGAGVRALLGAGFTGGTYRRVADGRGATLSLAVHDAVEQAEAAGWW